MDGLDNDEVPREGQAAAMDIDVEGANIIIPENVPAVDEAAPDLDVADAPAHQAQSEEEITAEVLAAVQAADLEEEEHRRAADLWEEEQRQAQLAADMADSQGRQNCYICSDDIIYANILQLSCGEHWICKDCLPSVFENALSQESSYPPQCCHDMEQILIEDFEYLLSLTHPDLILRYKAKGEEYKTDVRFRRYCGEKDCNSFLPPSMYQHIADMTVADCITCNRTTCIGCGTLTFKSSPHECVVEAPKLNTNYGPEARFKNCPYCSVAVLITEGCNHMTCICGGEWCFVCLQPYGGGNYHTDCIQYNDPQYDADGFDASGFHRDSGLDREGFNREGYNIKGLDRDGNKVAGFARREVTHFGNGPARPQGFLDVDDGEFEIAAALQLIAEQQAGAQHETDDLARLMAARFGHPGPRGRGRGRGRGMGMGFGARGRGRGGVRGGFGGHRLMHDDIDHDIAQIEQDDEDEAEEDTDDNDVDPIEQDVVNAAEGMEADDGIGLERAVAAGNRLMGRGGIWRHQRRRGVPIIGEDPDHPDVEFHGFREDRVGGLAMNPPDPANPPVTVPMPDEEDRDESTEDEEADSVDEATWAERLLEEEENLRRHMAELDAENPFNGLQEDPTQDAAVVNVPADEEVDPNPPQGPPTEGLRPTPASLTCAHDWDVHVDSGAFCSACRFVAGVIMFHCTTCRSWACQECYSEFAANAGMNWPELEEADAEEGAGMGGAGVGGDGEPGVQVGDDGWEDI